MGMSMRQLRSAAALALMVALAAVIGSPGAQCGVVPECGGGNASSGGGGCIIVGEEEEKQQQRQKRVEEESSEMLESETSGRVLQGIRRYISYEVLRADMVPCSRPGVPYYNCHAPPRFNAYHRACGIITRCARYDYP